MSGAEAQALGFDLGADRPGRLITHNLVLTPDQHILTTGGQPVQALSPIYGAAFAAAGETLYVAGDCRNGSSFQHSGQGDIGAVNLATGKPTSWAPHGFARRSALGFACFQALAADDEQALVTVDSLHQPRLALWVLS